MRHRVAHRKLGRTAAHRRALLRNLATELVVRGAIETSTAKAKELRSVVERLVTVAKTDNVTTRRKIASYLKSAKAVEMLFSKVAQANAQRTGGYTRSVRSRIRVGDATPMSIISFVDAEPYMTQSVERRSKKNAAAQAAQQATEAAK